jgi:hypothetical protein
MLKMHTDELEEAEAKEQEEAAAAKKNKKSTPAAGISIYNFDL